MKKLDIRAQFPCPECFFSSAAGLLNNGNFYLPLNRNVFVCDEFNHAFDSPLSLENLLIDLQSDEGWVQLIDGKNWKMNENSSIICLNYEELEEIVTNIDESDWKSDFSQFPYLFEGPEKHFQYTDIVFDRVIGSLFNEKVLRVFKRVYSNNSYLVFPVP
jgi:hypothetical protein